MCPKQAYYVVLTIPQRRGQGERRHKAFASRPNLPFPFFFFRNKCSGVSLDLLIVSPSLFLTNDETDI